MSFLSFLNTLTISLLYMWIMGPMEITDLADKVYMYGWATSAALKPVIENTRDFCILIFNVTGDTSWVLTSA